jgi:hypothetical protein
VDQAGRASANDGDETDRPVGRATRTAWVLSGVLALVVVALVVALIAQSGGDGGSASRRRRRPTSRALGASTTSATHVEAGATLTTASTTAPTTATTATPTTTTTVASGPNVITLSAPRDYSCKTSGSEVLVPINFTGERVASISVVNSTTGATTPIVSPNPPQSPWTVSLQVSVRCGATNSIVVTIVGTDGSTTQRTLGVTARATRP